MPETKLMMSRRKWFGGPVECNKDNNDIGEKKKETQRGRGISYPLVLP
jgi:hypothetical protein